MNWASLLCRQVPLLFCAKTWLPTINSGSRASFCQPGTNSYFCTLAQATGSARMASAINTTTQLNKTHMFDMMGMMGKVKEAFISS